MLPVGMNDTVILPNYTIGPKAYDSFTEIVSEFGTRFLLVSGINSWKAVKRIFNKMLSQSDLEMAAHETYGSDCTFERIHELADKALRMEVNFIVGIGGGKALDTAKGVAYEAHIPIVTLPTSASTCAAATAQSMVYKSKGHFDQLYIYEKPADHVFINTQVIAEAPVKYFTAGIGNVIVKYFDIQLELRGNYVPILAFVKQSIKDCKEQTASYEMEQVILGSIICTAVVSAMEKTKHKAAIAYALYFGLALLPEIDQNYLYGSVVAYGILVQLAIDRRVEEAIKLRKYMLSLGIPVSLRQMKVECSREYLKSVLEETVKGPSLEQIPYQVTEDMVYNGIVTIEKINNRREREDEKVKDHSEGRKTGRHEKNYGFL
ncbi:glycerol dehydrogenase [Lachnospiraceae bacterium KM106-2]|nr:glycerol dehydrogenase [Lachnospiraceae bacterium KM106-2]